MDAMQIALEAKHTADLALQNQAAHERLCAERYSNINRQLSDVALTQKDAARDFNTSISKIYGVLDSLRATANKAGGIDIALRYLCLLIGAAGVIYGISHRG